MLNFKSKLSHLSGEQVLNIENICDKIIETGKADIIILFGNHAFPDKNIHQNSAYEILVITDHFETREELSRELKEAFKDQIPPVRGVIETITYVNINVEQGLFYFSDILGEGIVLYDNKEFELSKPKIISPAKRKKIASEDYREWRARAMESWNGFLNDFELKNWRGCAFNLHQVVEYCYTTIEMVFSHNFYEEHNIKTQRDRIRAFDQRLHEAFPLETKSQIEDFEYLNKTYVGARYLSEADFPVKSKQVDYWAQESRKLLEITALICKGKIERLRDVQKRDKRARK